MQRPPPARPNACRPAAPSTGHRARSRGQAGQALRRHGAAALLGLVSLTACAQPPTPISRPPAEAHEAAVPASDETHPARLPPPLPEAAVPQAVRPGSLSRAEPAQGLAAAVLPPEVLLALHQSRIPSEALSVVVQNADDGAPHLRWRAEQWVNPASLTKLLTTYAALDLLGPAWTWSTPVWLTGPIRNPGPQGVLEGDLVIQGSGDPKWVLERVWLMLRRIQQLGIREIRGDIVLDRSAFAPPDREPGDFDGEALRPYNVGADALLLNHKSLALRFSPQVDAERASVAPDPALEGVDVSRSVPLSNGACGDWQRQLDGRFDDPSRLHFGGSLPAACGERVWQLAYPEPASYNGRLLRAMWAELGGRLQGTVRDGQAPGDAPTLNFESPPLAEVVRDINKFSNNTMAQQLFLTLGYVQRGEGSPAMARALMRDWMAGRLGADAGQVVIDNGSGLSRETRVSANQLAELLTQAWRSPVMPELMASLPINGLDGTLRRSRAPAGRAHLKTGSLRDVNGIAGYVDGEQGRRLILVAIVNHPNASAARPVLDALIEWAAAPQHAAP